jgi:Na+-driven multidrug efflux pump
MGLLLCGGAILERMNLEGQVLSHARTYLSIAGEFIFPQALINIFASLIRTYGFTVGRRVGANQADDAYRRGLETLKWSVAVSS